MSESARTTPPIEIKEPKGKITLKQFALSDAKEIFELIDRNREHLSQFSDETAQKYPTLESVIDSIQNPKNPKRLRFTIRNKNGVFMGSINLTPDEGDPQKGEIGFYMGSEFQSKGYATEATRILSNFALRDLGYQTLYAAVHPDNVASQRVLVKVGYQETGIKNGDKLFTLTK